MRLRAALALLALLCAGRAAADAVPISAQDVAARWHGRLAERHFSASVRMEVDLGGLREERRMRVYRDDEGGGERVLIRFDAPPDLRNVGLLYLEHAGQPNDYFLYQPTMRRIRRLPETIADDDVYGIDLEFLGFGVAQTAPTTLGKLARESLDGRAVFKLEEAAAGPNRRFQQRVTWIDAESYVPLRTEHRRDERLVLVAETLELGVVQGVATPKRMRFTRPIERREVLFFVDAVDYEAPIPQEHFSAITMTKSALDK